VGGETMRGTGAEVLSGIPIGKLSSLFNTIENGPGKAAGENIDCLKDNRKTNGQHSLSGTGDFVIRCDVIWLSYFTDVCSLSLDDRL